MRPNPPWQKVMNIVSSVTILYTWVFCYIEFQVVSLFYWWYPSFGAIATGDDASISFIEDLDTTTGDVVYKRPIEGINI